MFFRKTADSKELETKIKEAEAKANQEISDIEKLADPAERLARYEALSETLRGVYDGSKPKRVKGRKETRAAYGSVKNARALYKIEQTVKERSAKEAEEIRSAERVAEIQKQFTQTFKKEAPVAATSPKAKGALFEDIETEANHEIRDIEKIAEPAERLGRYEALNETLRTFYNGDLSPMFWERKKFRPVYGSIKNARAVYKLKEEVVEKIGKEQEIIRSLERTAQLQQRFKESFGREAPAKDKAGILKEVKAEISEDIKEIKKIADPAERVERYQALDKTLDGFYDGMKPGVTDGNSAIGGAAVGALAGDLIGGAIAIIAFPAATLPVAAAIVVGSTLSVATGGAGLGGLLGGKEERKQLRAKYGSIRNARALYKLDKTVQKKTEKDAEPLRSRDHTAKLRQQLDDAFKKKDPATPAESVPASTPLKLRRQPEVKQ